MKHWALHSDRVTSNQKAQCQKNYRYIKALKFLHSMYHSHQVFIAKEEAGEGLETMEVSIRLKSMFLKSSSLENNEIGLHNLPSLSLDHIFGKINLFPGTPTISRLAQLHATLLLRSSLSVL